MTKRVGTTIELRRRMLEAMRRETGINEKTAVPFVDVIMACFAGERLYFPAEHRRYPVEKIAAAIHDGASVKEVVCRFQLSRTKLYELFPGGLPRPAKSQGIKSR
ncbi:hypothetical protein XSP_001057 [Xanthomonas euroxanthea]|uniref:Mor transcription activator domain-containing protein n=1 Tax=Xanthomonas euroxanthea TaxID=2259622 RepID=A0A8E4DRN4_9XANT|nr:hypothetical protein [Xanthomonas euroxanthea]CAD1788776.1 hypothetical protein XSP_001057 [Xanthomonas euroxanthea]SYZ52259.1 hypothetical protein CPBF367_10630 [Xanthomonas arboricola pv. juglandis]